MKTFQNAVQDQRRLTKEQQAAERKREAAKEKAKRDAIARRTAPFHAAAVVLEALMKVDPDFAKYLKKRVAFKGNMYAHNIASVEFGTHAEHDGWVGEMTETFKDVKTDWCLVVALSDTGKVRLEIYTNKSDQRQPQNLDDMPDEVCSAFQSILKALQDREKVYGFLLSKYGA